MGVKVSKLNGYTVGVWASTIYFVFLLALLLATQSHFDEMDSHLSPDWPFPLFTVQPS